MVSFVEACAGGCVWLDEGTGVIDAEDSASAKMKAPRIVMTRQILIFAFLPIALRGVHFTITEDIQLFTR